MRRKKAESRVSSREDEEERGKVPTGSFSGKARMTEMKSEAKQQIQAQQAQKGGQQGGDEPGTSWVGERRSRLTLKHGMEQGYQVKEKQGSSDLVLDHCPCSNDACGKEWYEWNKCLVSEKFNANRGY